MLGTRSAAAADDLRALGAPATSQLPVLETADLGLDPPAAARVVAEVRIHPQRHVGEVAQVGDHPVDVIRRNAVSQQRRDAHLLKPARGAPKRVALGPAPMLTVDPAQAMQAAAERQPHRDLQPDQRLHHPEQRRRDHRQRLQQDQIGRIVPRASGLATPPSPRFGATYPVDIAVERERHHALVRATRLGDRLPGHPDAAPRGLHPMHVTLLATPSSPLAVTTAGSAHVFVVITSTPAST